jgi:hypothetical protein
VTPNGQDEDPKENGKETSHPASPISDPQAQTPFEKFEEFVRRVVSVPKRVIDEREKEYQEGRHNK